MGCKTTVVASDPFDGSFHPSGRAGRTALPQPDAFVAKVWGSFMDYLAGHSCQAAKELEKVRYQTSLFATTAHPAESGT